MISNEIILYGEHPIVIKNILSLHYWYKKNNKEVESFGYSAFNIIITNQSYLLSLGILVRYNFNESLR